MHSRFPSSGHHQRPPLPQQSTSFSRSLDTCRHYWQLFTGFYESDVIRQRNVEDTELGSYLRHIRSSLCEDMRQGIVEQDSQILKAKKPTTIDDATLRQKPLYATGLSRTFSTPGKMQMPMYRIGPHGNIVLMQPNQQKATKSKPSPSSSATSLSSEPTSCLEFFAKEKIPDLLVDHAIVNQPRGILLLVLEFFQKIIAELEASYSLTIFRSAIRNLVTHCLTTRDSASSVSDHADSSESGVSDTRGKKDLILNLTRARSAMVLVRTMINHVVQKTSLVSIIFDPDIGFYLFDLAVAYMGVPDMRLRKTARDAVVETLNLASGHPRVMAHVMDRVRFPEYLNDILSDLFAEVTAPDVEEQEFGGEINYENVRKIQTRKDTRKRIFSETWTLVVSICTMDGAEIISNRLIGVLSSGFLNGLSTAISVGYDIATLAHDPLWSQFIMRLPSHISKSTVSLATQSLTKAEKLLEQIIRESQHVPRLLRIVLDVGLLGYKTLRSINEHAADDDEEVALPALRLCWTAIQTFDSHTLELLLLRDLKVIWCPNYSEMKEEDAEPYDKFAARFLDLTPDTTEIFDDTTYDAYILHALESFQYSNLMMGEDLALLQYQLSKISSPSLLHSPSSLPTSGSKTSTSSTYRITFLDALIKQLRRAATVSTEVNLIVTAIIAEIARLTDPGVDEFLGMLSLDEDDETAAAVAEEGELEITEEVLSPMMMTMTMTETEEERLQREMAEDLADFGVGRGERHRPLWDLDTLTEVPSNTEKSHTVVVDSLQVIPTRGPRYTVFFALKEAVIQEAKLAQEALSFLVDHYRERRQRKYSVYSDAAASDGTPAIAIKSSRRATVINTPELGFTNSPSEGSPDPDQVIRTHQLLKEFCRELAAIILVKGNLLSQSRVDEDLAGKKLKWNEMIESDTASCLELLEEEERDWIWGWCNDSGSEDEELVYGDRLDATKKRKKRRGSVLTGPLGEAIRAELGMTTDTEDDGGMSTEGWMEEDEDIALWKKTMSLWKNEPNELYERRRVRKSGGGF